VNEKSTDVHLRMGSSAEPPMQASKWLKTQLLVDAAELQSLFEALGPIFIYQISGIIKPGGGRISAEEFLRVYAGYIDSLKAGVLPPDSSYRQLFSSVITSSLDSLYAVEVGPQQQLIRITLPVIQLQAHRLDYSSVDGKFRSMVLGPESIVWGIQVSYPQLYENPQTSKIEQVIDSPQFPNTKLFKILQKWVRHQTAPTPFVVGEIRTNVPIRLGKQCFSWINNHPQLIKKGISVKDY